MVRAMQTGSYVAAALNLPLVAWEDLHEGGGIFVIDRRPASVSASPAKLDRNWRRAFRSCSCWRSADATTAGGTARMNRWSSRRSARSVSWAI